MRVPAELIPAVAVFPPESCSVPHAGSCHYAFPLSRNSEFVVAKEAIETGIIGAEGLLRRDAAINGHLGNQDREASSIA
jgi:hypothetical protein